MARPKAVTAPSKAVTAPSKTVAVPSKTVTGPTKAGTIAPDTDTVAANNGSVAPTTFVVQAKVVSVIAGSTRNPRIPEPVRDDSQCSGFIIAADSTCPGRQPTQQVRDTRQPRRSGILANPEDPGCSPTQQIRDTNRRSCSRTTGDAGSRIGMAGNATCPV